jgi:NAD(P)H-hydrate repair Nnr-like enzyme with NAD(P)H-hydrate epimerase domain
MLVDALFGTGLKTPLAGLFETVAADINASDLAVVSVDIRRGCRPTPRSRSARTSTRR